MTNHHHVVIVNVFFRIVENRKKIHFPLFFFFWKGFNFYVIVCFSRLFDFSMISNIMQIEDNLNKPNNDQFFFVYLKIHFVWNLKSLVLETWKRNPPYLIFFLLNSIFYISLIRFPRIYVCWKITLNE
jgi:hypothetical protein